MFVINSFTVLLYYQPVLEEVFTSVTIHSQCVWISTHLFVTYVHTSIQLWGILSTYMAIKSRRMWNCRKVAVEWSLGWSMCVSFGKQKIARPIVERAGLVARWCYSTPAGSGRRTRFYQSDCRRVQNLTAARIDPAVALGARCV